MSTKKIQGLEKALSAQTLTFSQNTIHSALILVFIMFVLFSLQVITIGRHVKGYHYIIANLVSTHVGQHIYYNINTCNYICNYMLFYVTGIYTLDV